MNINSKIERIPATCFSLPIAVGKRSVLILLLTCISFNAVAQIITAGPVTGAVTDSSANILFFTDRPASGELQLSLQLGSAYILAFPFQTDQDNVVNVQLNRLQPATRYYFTIVLDSIQQSIKGSFKTFTPPGDSTYFSFTLGSCTEQRFNDSIFLTMQQHQPAFFLHLGDWLYTHHYNESEFYYTQNMSGQKELYQKRYEMPNLKKLLQSTPIDFVFDDEDGVHDDFSKDSYTELIMNGNTTAIKEIPYPDSLREMLMQGLHTYFPSYREIEHQAYHSFVYGNAEIFFLDTRSTRSPNSASFYQSKSGKWKYKVPEGHEILDSVQFNWLLTKLQNSKANWKFIVSGVTFNQSYKQVLDMSLRAQKRTFPNGLNGAYVAASLATMWFAFPETQTRLLNFCHDHKIKNVILLSGDAHTAAIDDGSNAGFPELMAGGLAQQNSKLASIIYNQLHLNLWNQGGQGKGNTNFNDAFGKVEVFGKDSVRLSAIDKYGKEICIYNLKDGFIPKHFNLRPLTKINRVKALRNLLRIAVKR
jgi:hypothetical protein